MDKKEPEAKNNQNQKTGFIDKFKSVNKTPFLIAGLVILTGILLVVSLNSRLREPRRGGGQEIQKDFAKTSLSISDEVRTSTISGVFETNVNIDTDENLVTGVQLELEYDPEILNIIDIRGGGFFEDPQILLKEVDSENGRITYVQAIKIDQESVTGEGTVAVISFEKESDEPAFINFLPQTLVSSQNFDQSVLKETISAVIGQLPNGN